MTDEHVPPPSPEHNTPAADSHRSPTETPATANRRAFLGMAGSVLLGGVALVATRNASGATIPKDRACSTTSPNMCATNSCRAQNYCNGGIGINSCLLSNQCVGPTGNNICSGATGANTCSPNVCGGPTGGSNLCSTPGSNSCSPNTCIAPGTNV